MAKLTQTSTTLDRNNCTVLALKSVTGWQERKCQRILSEGGRRQNRGFDIQGYIADNQGKIGDATFEVAYAKYGHSARVKVSHLVAAELGIKIGSKEYYTPNREFFQRETALAKELGFSMVSYGEKPMTLKRFAKENPVGAFYIVINGHALAIINGIIVDNLSGKLGGEGRQIKMAYKVTGNIKPNVGKVSRLDTKPKRHARLKYREVVKYVGPNFTWRGITLMKKGDHVKIDTQQHNGLVVVEFRTADNRRSLKCKIDRADFEVTKLREEKYFEPLKGNYKLANTVISFG
jgi:hypothetical protein